MVLLSLQTFTREKNPFALRGGPGVLTFLRELAEQPAVDRRRYRQRAAFQREDRLHV